MLLGNFINRTLAFVKWLAMPEKLDSAPLDGTPPVQPSGSLISWLFKRETLPEDASDITDTRQERTILEFLFTRETLEHDE